MEASTEIRVFLVDDHPVVRQALATLLDATPNVVVVGEAANGEQAVTRVDETAPEVVLMDVSMPVMDGVEATRRITSNHPEIKVIALSLHETPEKVQSMREAGAADFLIKGCANAEVIQAIRKAANGDR